MREEVANKRLHTSAAQLTKRNEVQTPTDFFPKIPENIRKFWKFYDIRRKSIQQTPSSQRRKPLKCGGLREAVSIMCMIHYT